MPDETIAKVSGSKNAKEEAERLEKIDETINYDKLSTLRSRINGGFNKQGVGKLCKI